MEPIALKFDVASALPREVTGGRPLHIAMWLFLPPALPEARRTVVTLLNGGSYDKRYFHVHVPGREGYSMAEYLASRGHIVMLPDHLGITDSERAVEQIRVTRQIAAAANHEAMRQAYAKLEAGTLHPSLPPIGDYLKIGGGHSMGGMQTITQQAEHATYDRVLVLGYTAIGVHLSWNGQMVSADQPYSAEKGDYWLLDHAAIAESFHWDDVPRDVLAVDEQLAVHVPQMLSWQSTTMGIVSDDAGRITVPVYICLGERDVSPDPHAEPAYYKGSKDVTLHILPRSGHCQSFAGTRTEMYDRIHRWIGSIA